jgi:hypothetical protein
LAGLDGRLLTIGQAPVGSRRRATAPPGPRLGAGLACGRRRIRLGSRRTDAGYPFFVPRAGSCPCRIPLPPPGGCRPRA